jgi:hypothetical protein
VLIRTEDTALSDSEEVDLAGLSYDCLYLSCNSWILALHSSTSDSTVLEYVSKSSKRLLDAIT